MTALQNYFDILADNPIAILAGLIFILAISMFYYWRFKRKPKVKTPLVEIPSKGVILTKPNGEQFVVVPPTGKYRAMVLRPGEIDFTSIEKPIGESLIVDTSLPNPGTTYLVIEKDGQVIDYDERKLPYEAGKSPSQAYICTHCDDIIQDFWTADVKWYANVNNWFAAGMLILDFFALMAVFGE